MFEFLKIIISLLIWILVFYLFKFLSKRNLKLVIVFNLCIYVYGVLYYYNNTNLKYIWLAMLFSIVMIKNSKLTLYGFLFKLSITVLLTNKAFS